MINILTIQSTPLNVTEYFRHVSFRTRIWFACLIGISCLIGVISMRSAPSFGMIGWIFFIIGIVAILYEPRYGVYQIIGFALAGDMILTPWFPFVKNLSSAESLLYIGRATSFSPAELFIVLTFISWLGRAAMQRKLSVFTGQLFWPNLLFTIFITTGLIYGLTHQGDQKIALWEVRVIYYLPAMLLLTSNLIKNKYQLNILIWVAILAICFDACSGIIYIASILKFNIRSVEAIAEHSYSIHINTLFVLLAATWMFHGSKIKQLFLISLLPVVLISYFANQRRASFITLAVAFILIGFVLYHIRKKVFFTVTPMLAIFSLLYIGIFWNSTGGIALPARAIRSVIAPQQGGRDDSSNIYRVVENINTKFTISVHPFTGVGFGNKFYIIAPMPDISFFEWWQYITHNSILWIWMQTGLLGFLSLLLLIFTSINTGVRAIWHIKDNDLRSAVFSATVYVIMHFIYAYVDMSWEAQSMIYIGAMIGIINCAESISSKEDNKTN